MLARCPHCQAYSNTTWATCPVCGQLLRAVAATPAPEPPTSYDSCVVCEDTDRWDDHGIWRCRRCWLEPGTQVARLAAEREQAHLAAQRQVQRTSESRPKPRDPRLGPILPPCAACGELRHWHNHATETWQCWACTPPALRKRNAETQEARHG